MDPGSTAGNGRYSRIVPGSTPGSCRSLRHGATQRKFFRETILRGPSHRVRRRLKEILTEVALREMVAGGLEKEAEPAATGRARAVAGAFFALLEWWLDEGKSLSIEEVDHVFQRSVGVGAG